MEAGKCEARNQTNTGDVVSREREDGGCGWCPTGMAKAGHRVFRQRGSIPVRGPHMGGRRAQQTFQMQ